MAQNVIVPVIDLTSAAEGSSVPDYLTNALAFGSQTAFAVENTTAVIANTAGFWRIFGAASVYSSSTTANAFLQMSDGLSTKNIWAAGFFGTNIAAVGNVATFDFNVFLASGESISAFSQAAGAHLRGSVRQIADVNGKLINPSGFSPQ